MATAAMTIPFDEVRAGDILHDPAGDLTVISAKPHGDEGQMEIIVRADKFGAIWYFDASDLATVTRTLPNAPGVIGITVERQLEMAQMDFRAAYKVHHAIHAALVVTTHHALEDSELHSEVLKAFHTAEQELDLAKAHLEMARIEFETAKGKRTSAPAV